MVYSVVVVVVEVSADECGLVSAKSKQQVAENDGISKAEEQKSKAGASSHMSRRP